MDTEVTPKNNNLLTCNEGTPEVMSFIPKQGGKPVKVTLLFAEKPKPLLRETIAGMLIESFVKGRKTE